MRYIKADYVFPEELLKEIQRYVHGELIYIPKMREERKNGEKKQGPENIWIKETLKLAGNSVLEYLLINSQKLFVFPMIVLKKLFTQKIQNNKGLEEKIILRSFLCILDYKLFYI